MIKPKRSSNETMPAGRFLRLAQHLGACGQLKHEMRWNGVNHPLADSTAAHSWQMLYMAFLLRTEYGRRLKLNWERVYELIAVHDLPEAIAGDVTFDKVYSGQVTVAQKKQREKKALSKLCGLYTRSVAKQVWARWREYEACETPEARFVKTIDKAEAALHSLKMQPSSWQRNGRKVAPFITHSNSVCGLYPPMNGFMRALKRYQRRECKKAGITWIPEYDGFKDLA